jgi:hypothetical protein
MTDSLGTGNISNDPSRTIIHFASPAELRYTDDLPLVVVAR